MLIIRKIHHQEDSNCQDVYFCSVTFILFSCVRLFVTLSTAACQMLVQPNLICGFNTVSIKISVWRIFFFFFCKTHQTDPQIHMEDIMGETEMFLKKSDSEVLPGLSESEGLQSVQSGVLAQEKGQSKDSEEARAIHTLLSIQCKIEVAFPIWGRAFILFFLNKQGKANWLFVSIMAYPGKEKSFHNRSN